MSAMQNQIQENFDQLKENKTEIKESSNIPKLKFTISGMNCELPQSLSQRRNSAMQSLFMTTTSISSALQSARGGLNSTQTNLDQLQTQVNFESTQELKAFATVDLNKINKDRQNQLKMALEDNLREKERELRDIELTYQQQRDEYDRISARLNEKSVELDNEVKKQKEYLQNLKEQFREIEAEYKDRVAQYKEFMTQNQGIIQEACDKIEVENKEIKQRDSELQVLQVQKKGLQMGIELQKKVKLQELDMKIQPLCEEKDKMYLHIQMLEQNLSVLLDVKSQNENEKMMIDEDLTVSEQTKVELVFQREELEELIEKNKEQNYDLNFIIQMMLQTSTMQHDQQWNYLLQQLVLDKQRTLLLDLIRELQQYILGMSSATTDNSVMQSDELEDIQYLIEGNQIDLTQAVDMIVEFAERKIKLGLNSESLMDKMEQVYDQIDVQGIQQAFQESKQVEVQMQDLDRRIKVVNNRCENELKPRQKALVSSETQLQDEIIKAEATLKELQEYTEEIENEINLTSASFEQNYMNNQDDISEIEEKLEKVQEQIQQLEYEMDSLKQSVQSNELAKLNAMNDKQLSETEFEEYKQVYQERSQQLKVEIKRERQQQTESFVNPLIEELSLTVAQIKCDKESQYKRLKYVETKLSNAKESVQHAKQVLENQILQAQQEQLNQKVTGVNYALNLKRGQQTNNGSTSAAQRIVNIQAKASTLQHGEILSPSKDTSAHQLPRKNQSLIKNKQGSVSNIAIPQSDNERMHSHYIDQSNISDMKKEAQRNFTSAQKQRQINNAANPSFVENQQNIHQNQDKSTIDVVKYYYDSSSAMSSSENNETATLSQHYQNFNKMQNVGQNKQKQIPIQSLITPREVLHEIQSTDSHQKDTIHNNFIQESGDQTYSMPSNDSISQNSSLRYERKNSIHMNDTATICFLQNNNSNHLLYKNQKISLRQNNSSYDGGKSQQQLKNVVIPLYSQFKENIMPINLSNQQIPTTHSFNMRKLSQASNLSHISNSSILNSLTGTQGSNRPPAVPQSKLASQYINNGGDSSTPRGSSQKHKRHTMNSSGSSRNRLDSGTVSISNNHQQQQFTNHKAQGVQTRMKLNMNANNGRVIQVGVVDLSRCNPNQKDTQFFENVKPLIEGASFLVFRDNQFVLKQMFLDLSLLRLYLTNFNGEKEIIMIENIIKTEIPQSTLEQIKQEKNSSFQGSMNQSKKYEYNLILNSGGYVERMQLLSTNYEELRLWIIGLNALIGNKSNLMRLQSLINSN